MIHKRTTSGDFACGSPDRTRQGPHVSALYWDAVDCPGCLAVKPASASVRGTIKRSHRAEGDNYVD